MTKTNPSPLSYMEVSVNVNTAITSSETLPVQNMEKITVTVLTPEEDDKTLSTGNTLVFFLREAEIIWGPEGGRKTVNLFVSSPEQSSFIYTGDGLYEGGPNSEVLTLDEILSKVSLYTDISNP